MSTATITLEAADREVRPYQRDDAQRESTGRELGFVLLESATTPTTVNIDLEAEQEITPLFQSYRKAAEDRRQAGEQLGLSLLRCRNEYKKQGSHDGDGFKALLTRLGIPRATAYRLIRRADSNFVSVRQSSPGPLAFLDEHAKKLKFDAPFALFIGFLSFESLQSAYAVGREQLTDDLKPTLDWLWAVVQRGYVLKQKGADRDSATTDECYAANAKGLTER